MTESSKSIQEQVDFWLNDKRVLKIMENKKGIFSGYYAPDFNPSGFVQMCEKLDKLGRL